MRFKIIILFGLFSIIKSKDNEDPFLTCTEEFCEEYLASKGCPELSVECKVQNSTHNGIFVRYPDTCNCCKYCITNLQKGDECEIGHPGLPPPTKICGPTLTCTPRAGDFPTCQPIQSDCLNQQEDYDKRKSVDAVGVTEVRPNCNADGTFSPVHCVPGSICYCVSPDGHRIFGELPFLSFKQEEEMTCSCSIIAWKAMQTLSPQFQIPVVRCTESGSFDPLQCTMEPNPYCFCIDPVTGTIDGNTEFISESDLKTHPPSCFDSSRHSTEGFTTLCEKLHKENVYMYNSKDNNYYCQVDGKFSRIQIFGSKKVCVDSDGRKIEKYEAQIDSSEGKIMDCNCARTRWILQKAGVQELPDCCNFGNFKSWQCHRERCFCVNKNGDQLEMEVTSDKISTLSCYQKNNGDPCLV